MVVNIEGNEEIDQTFLFHFLSFYNFTSIISGSGQPQIVRTPLERIKVPNIALSMQKQISNVLDTLMNKIGIEKHVLDNFQRQKTYLLAVMFI